MSKIQSYDFLFTFLGCRKATRCTAYLELQGDRYGCYGSKVQGAVQLESSHQLRVNIKNIWIHKLSCEIIPNIPG